MKNNSLTHRLALAVSRLFSGKKPAAPVILAFATLLLQTQVRAQDPACAPIRVRIIDQLAEDQTAERVRIDIGGVVKQINLDTRHPSGYVDFFFATPGAYRVTTTSATAIIGESTETPGYSSGTLTVDSGAVFAITGDYSQSPVAINLRKIGPTSRPDAPRPVFTDPAPAVRNFAPAWSESGPAPRVDRNVIETQKRILESKIHAEQSSLELAQKRADEDPGLTTTMMLQSEERLIQTYENQLAQLSAE